MRPIKKLLTRFSRAAFLVRISGESMWPTFVPGRRYLASALRSPRTGDFLVFRSPKNPTEIFVKRVEDRETGGWRVGGLVSWSSSSRDFGTVPATDILGVVIARWNF